MDFEHIVARHNAVVQPMYGTTTPEELLFIQRIIQKHKPKRILEIGTASGLTTGFLAQFLEETGGISVTSLDLSQKFFAQPSQDVGFLARQIYTGSRVEIRIETGKTSLDLAPLNETWDLAFVDANHNHPWPTLDTLALAPFLKGSRIVIHHDLQLFRRFKGLLGVGPRVLFNETPDAYRHANDANGWNIFYLDLNMPQETLEEVASNALSMPWTARPALWPRELAAIRTVLAQHYSADLLHEFDDAALHNQWSKIQRALFYLRDQRENLRRRMFGKD